MSRTACFLSVLCIITVTTALGRNCPIWTRHCKASPMKEIFNFKTARTIKVTKLKNLMNGNKFRDYYTSFPHIGQMWKTSRPCCGTIRWFLPYANEEILRSGQRKLIPTSKSVSKNLLKGRRLYGEKDTKTAQNLIPFCDIYSSFFTTLRSFSDKKSRRCY